MTILLLGDPRRALRGDSDDGVACRPDAHVRRVGDCPAERGARDGTGDLVSTDEPLTDRRQRALETAYDNPHISNAARTSPAVRTMVREAIEVATRVQISDDIVEAFGEALRALNREQAAGREPAPPEAKRKAGLAAAFRAAGFEVVES